MKNQGAIWVMNGLLAVCAVLLLILVVGRDPIRPAHASGGGASLDNWMLTVLGQSEKLIICKQDGPKLRINVYETGGPQKTMLLKEVRDTEIDFAMPMELVEFTVAKGTRGQTYQAIKDIHLKYLEAQVKRKKRGRLR